VCSSLGVAFISLAFNMIRKALLFCLAHVSTLVNANLNDRFNQLREELLLTPNCSLQVALFRAVQGKVRNNGVIVMLKHFPDWK